MEQTIVDFFAKASELILHNRLPPNKSLEAALNNMTNPNQHKFQLCFEQKFNFNSIIPPQWSSQTYRPLVVEFHLVMKSSGEKFLAEQWIFVLNQVSDNKLKYTVDSPNTLYKKLSVLLRTISLLTVTLPLYKHFIKDKNGPLAEAYSLDYSIHFSNRTLSSWHPSIHEEGSSTNYINPDLVLPGRNFSFQVNYPKSFKFLQRLADESKHLEPKTLQVLKEKLDIDYFAGQNRRDRGMSDPILLNNIAKSIRKSTSDTNRFNISNGLHSSPKDSYPGNNALNSDAISDNAASPIGSLLASSPIETQKSPTHLAEARSRKNSGGMPWEGMRASGGGNRPRFATVNSESSGEYDMYIYEDDGGGFTEVLSGKEINIRDESPAKFSMHPKASEDEQFFMEISRKLENNELKLSTNTKPIEKIIEQNDDDKIAEIIGVVETLKNVFDRSYGSGSRKDGTMMSSKMSNGKSMKELVQQQDSQNGLRFFSEGPPINEERGLPTVSADLVDLMNLYHDFK